MFPVSATTQFHDTSESHLEPDNDKGCFIKLKTNVNSLLQSAALLDILRSFLR